MYTLENLQNQIQNAFNNETFVRTPENLYLPVDYTLNQKGKRIRPMLMLISCDLFKGDTKNCIDAAIAIEIFHNFTLLHDDIMDQSPLRRGNPTVYKKWNTNTAILSGDVMFGMAYEYLLKKEHPHLAEILRLFTQTTIEICEGQQWDLELEKIIDPQINQYLEMIRLKTAVLLAASLKIGALYAGASSRNQDLIYEFGIKSGLAFQLQDDWLDCFGDQDKFGKPIGIDIIDNKKTFLFFTALQYANSQQKATLLEMYGNQSIDKEKKVQTVKRIFDELNIRELVLNNIESYYNEANQILNEIDAQDSDKEQLRLFIKTLMQRNY